MQYYGLNFQMKNIAENTNVSLEIKNVYLNALKAIK